MTGSALEDMLLYGMYRGVRNARSPGEKEAVLEDIVRRRLRDVAGREGVRKPDRLYRLLREAAYHIGNEVSLNRLRRILCVDYETVARHLELLERNRVLYCVEGYRGGLSKEVRKAKRYYFYDNGVRNAVIHQFGPLSGVTERYDQNELWENFMVMERAKFRTGNGVRCGHYFWRTWERQEIDLVEDHGGTLRAYNFRWTLKRPPRHPAKFLAAYPVDRYVIITPDNYAELFRDEQPC